MCSPRCFVTISRQLTYVALETVEMSFLLGPGLLIPRDPGSPSENGFMEPTYYAFRFGVWTPQSSENVTIDSYRILANVRSKTTTWMSRWNIRIKGYDQWVVTLTYPIYISKL